LLFFTWLFWDLITLPTAIVSKCVSKNLSSVQWWIRKTIFFKLLTKYFDFSQVGLSAIFGVCGSLTFPALRKKFGINRTGTIGFACLISVLSLSVLSIGLPGTLFEPKRGPEIFRYRNFSGNNESDSISNVSFIALAINSSFTNSTSFLEPEMKRKFNETIEKSIMNGTLFIEKKPVCFSSNYVSIGFFLAGVVGARFGLWIADLSINQILLEEVSEDHRGKINGVQTGLNSFMNTLKYLLVSLIDWRKNLT